MNGKKQRAFFLSVYPSSRGFAFVLFEGPTTPFDWGSKEVRERKKNAKTLEHIKRLVERYEPEVLVFEALTSKSRRSDRVVRLYRMLTHYAATRNLTVRRYTRDEVRACFASVGAVRKQEIAAAIAEQMPEFKHRIPRVRKPWMSESYQQGLFDAAALGVTHYAHATR